MFLNFDWRSVLNIGLSDWNQLFWSDRRVKRVYQWRKQYASFPLQWARTASLIHLTHWLYFIEGHFGYKRDDIVMLTDDSTNPRMMPTRENMVRGFHSSVAYFLILFYFSPAASNAMARGGCCAQWFSIFPLWSQFHIGHIFVLIFIPVRFRTRWSGQRPRRRWGRRFRRRLFDFVRMIDSHKLTPAMICSYLSCKSLAMRCWCVMYVNNRRWISRLMAISSMMWVLSFIYCAALIPTLSFCII